MLIPSPENRPAKSPAVKGRRPRVVLVYPFSPNRNNSVPLGLAMIASVMRERGCEVRAVDAAARLVEDENSRVLKAIDDMRPDAVALSVIVGNVRQSYGLIEEHLLPGGMPLIAGGPHASVLPEEVLEHGAHIVVRGEGEETAAELVEWLKGEKELNRIDGISYCHAFGVGDGIRHNPDRAPIADLDALPMPAHDLFDPLDYSDHPEDWWHFGKLISSRGCPNRCSFCANPVFGRKFRYRSPESVLAEMRMLREHYGINIFEFLDDAFTANRRRLLELAEALRRVPDVTFSCVTRLENLDEETVPALRAAGLYLAHIGVESARVETCKRIHKNIDLDKLEPTIRLLRKNGIESFLFFMFGFPWESAEEMRETNRLIEKLRPLKTSFAEGGVITPYPGTEIYDEYHEKVGFTKWWLKDYQPPSGKSLHHLQPYYFFPYNDEQMDVIREALDTIFEHNRIVKNIEVKKVMDKAEKEIDRITQIIYDLEEQVRDRDRQLRELWNRSLVEKIRHALAWFKSK